jgi:phytoene dehydrogenase-like protein
MFQRSAYDAIVVGSGPNGLSAAITLAQAGLTVALVESQNAVGGGVRSDELTLPGFIHDPCAAIFPLSRASPFLSNLPLEKYGLEWVDSPAVLAHPLDGGRAVLVDRSLEVTAERLSADGGAYRNLLQPILRDWERFVTDLLGPLPIPPKTPLTYAGFAAKALLPAVFLARTLFRDETARALFAGMAGHSMLALESFASGAFGLVLSLLSHAVGMPFPRGGAQAISRALAAYFEALGGEIVTEFTVEHLEDLPVYRAVLLDVAPRNFVRILGERLPHGYRLQLERYRYGVGVCKVDFALDGPVPWLAEECHQAATLHLGGTLEEIAAAERQVVQGQHPEKPYVLVAQHTLFDPTRAPGGMHTLWAYCHTPHNSCQDMSDKIEAQIERYAPGFKKRILARHVRTAREMEAYNPNYVGGDINNGVQDLLQMFTRPAVRLNPYTTPLKDVYICSSATPPGGGAHGMCGYHAAQAALRRVFQ